MEREHRDTRLCRQCLLIGTLVLVLILILGGLTALLTLGDAGRVPMSLARGLANVINGGF
jgi:hypothetical protein